MLPNGAVHVSGLWKRFHADKGRRLLRDQVQRIRTSPNERFRRKWRWALRDVTFHIEPGESVGLIGANGSGKSTLLKILARVMYPYAGDVSLSGRVGALIEVRAGIHPDLTGRENVFFYGSMLGLRRREIAKKFDEIVEFAELPDAIDRQVKFFSSGMQMRLGFAVAAFLEPDVLLVDEVLAVGDASFQHKCLDKMRDVLSQGTTLVFVSHDLAAVESVCKRGVWLNQGVVATIGTARDALRDYQATIYTAAGALERRDGTVSVRSVDVHGLNGSGIATGEPLEIRLSLCSPVPVQGSVFLGLSEGTSAPIFILRRDVAVREGETHLACRVETLPLPRGRYYVWGGLFDRRGSEFLPWHPMAHVDISGVARDWVPPGVVRSAPIQVPATWELSC